jgi:hypothetical protein
MELILYKASSDKMVKVGLPEDLSTKSKEGAIYAILRRSTQILLWDRSSCKQGKCMSAFSMGQEGYGCTGIWIPTETLSWVRLNRSVTGGDILIVLLGIFLKEEASQVKGNERNNGCPQEPIQKTICGAKNFLSAPMFLKRLPYFLPTVKDQFDLYRIWCSRWSGFYSLLRKSRTDAEMKTKPLATVA